MRQTAFVLSLAMLSFVMTVIWGPPLLRVLRHFRIGKLIRVDEPGHHNVKMGTPTMGGVLFIVPVLLLTGLLNAAVFIGLEVIGRLMRAPGSLVDIKLKHEKQTRIGGRTVGEE